jgi:hypothetical protein
MLGTTFDVRRILANGLTVLGKSVSINIHDSLLKLYCTASQRGRGQPGQFAPKFANGEGHRVQIKKLF